MKIESAADIENMSDEEFKAHSHELMNSSLQDDDNTSLESDKPKEEVDTPSENSEGTVLEENTVTEPESNVETTQSEETSKSTDLNDGQEESNSNSESDKAPTEEPDYKAVYQEFMKPFKANGKTMELKSPEEAISLMQKGANYTKKMADIAPYRKAISMLKQHNLLDEEKLSLFIDLDKKDPAAIQKFFADKDLDPLDVIATEPSEYNPSKNFVSPQSLNLQDTIEDLKETEEGQAVIDSVYSSWDSESQSVLCNNPPMFSYLQKQKADGTYDKVMAEIERQKTLGTIPASVNTFNAYSAIEQQFLKTSKAQVVAVGNTNEPNKEVNKKIKATQSTRSSPKGLPPTKFTPADIEKMSDEEFQKNKHLFL